MKKHRQGTKPEEVLFLVDIKSIAKNSVRSNELSTGESSKN